MAFFSCVFVSSSESDATPADNCAAVAFGMNPASAYLDPVTRPLFAIGGDYQAHLHARLSECLGLILLHKHAPATDSPEMNGRSGCMAAGPASTF